MKLNYSLQSTDQLLLEGQNSSPAVILIHGMFGSLSNLGVLARSLVAQIHTDNLIVRNQRARTSQETNFKRRHP